MIEENKCAVVLNPEAIDLLKATKFRMDKFLENEHAIICHKASNDGVFVRMDITHPDIAERLELQVPCNFVLAIASGKDVKSLGF